MEKSRSRTKKKRNWLSSSSVAAESSSQVPAYSAGFLLTQPAYFSWIIFFPTSFFHSPIPFISPANRAMSVVTPSLPSWAVPDIVAFPSFAHTELLLEQRIKIEVSPAIKLDADAQICRAHLTPSGCSEGHLCPKRHTNPSSLNYAPPPVHTSSHSKTVCKHWLRGLCKKGLDCEFLHEYNLRKMPECWFFTKHGFCSSGDECMYLHITPHQRRPECRSYTAGFCRAGKYAPARIMPFISERLVELTSIFPDARPRLSQQAYQTCCLPLIFDWLLPRGP